jgi:membrane-associated protein
MHLDVSGLIQSGGLLVIVLIVYLESGMMIGFFLPGDTLLLSAGIFAAQGQFPIELTIILIAVAAILGDNTGYAIGRAMGKRLFRKKDGIIFRQEYVAKAEKFYEKHGAKTLLIAHFVPIVRSFAPLVAGVAKMNRLQFIIFDAVGATAWAFTVTLLGYWFGSKIPNLDSYIFPVILIVMIISFAPMLWHIVRDRETRLKIRDRLATMLRRKAEDIDPDTDKTKH